jgi:hypothetical protein
MRYLGLDVHSEATVYCLLDAEGNELERGKVGASLRVGAADGWTRAGVMEPP